ncbi:ATP-binding cassette domain-containing protein [bacterium]|nr:ATP-binding cassette domain-containing protein [bacterium]
MSIHLENISKYYGSQVVVNNVNLEIKNGEFFVLLGASGSGKTTVLNIIAGLIEPDKGRVWLHDRDVTDLSTQKRNVGFVFQNYALFQYMTVAQNIEFGLQVRKISKPQRQRRRDELLELVGLVGLGNRMPSQLSGGQQQRVALARALAVEPNVLLLDEPLGALDAKIRIELRRSLKQIQRQLGVAAILVTHDQEEAFDLGDRIGVMNFGRLVEVGTPQSLYQYPKTEYVASFLGEANLLVGEVQGREVCLGSHGFPLPEDSFDMHAKGRAQILSRPEDVALARTASTLNGLRLGVGKVIEKGFNGATERLRVELPPIEGVRSISPIPPYGIPGFILDVNRSPEQCSGLPIELGQELWVGIRRLHVLSHPGLNFLILTDGTLRSQSALVQGGYMARMAHAQVTILGIGEDIARSEAHLPDARKEIGSGMAALELRSSPKPFDDSVHETLEQKPYDLVVLGWRPTAGFSQPESLLRTGEHHLFLATEPLGHLQRALICLASGEPGKDNVIFSGRLLRHFGASATLMTVLPAKQTNSYAHTRVERFLADGQKSLARFGVPSQVWIAEGDLMRAIQTEIANEDYDLVVLGMPLPSGQSGETTLEGAVGDILSNVENCSFLIIRSRHYQRIQNDFRRQ